LDDATDERVIENAANDHGMIEAGFEFASFKLSPQLRRKIAIQTDTAVGGIALLSPGARASSTRRGHRMMYT
jgi:hypothetical protein